MSWNSTGNSFEKLADCELTPVITQDILFEEKTLQRMLGHLKTLLEGVAANVEQGPLLRFGLFRLAETELQGVPQASARGVPGDHGQLPPPLSGQGSLVEALNPRRRSGAP